MDDYKELAEILYPDINMTIEDYEKMYPKRDLPESVEVMRFAPSPTGRMHMGNLYASFIPEVFSHQSNGIFILRIEDTDDKRAIENGINLILQDLEGYNYRIEEDPIKGGAYGPYIQSERKNIYSAFAKYLVSIGRAYPCFCSEEELNKIREHQTENKEKIGYYGKYAKCRNLTNKQVKEKIDNGEKFVIRLKSNGDFHKKIIFKDLIKGTIEIPENDMDHVLVKSDGIPPYAFAHVVDDYLMRITTVTRDDSYISSVPYHLEIWNAFGFKPPKYAHILPLNKKDGDTVRKLSKRKDPEAAVAFYREKGIPVEAVKLYFATLLNSNFEMWYMQNPNSNIKDFKFSFNKMTKSGSLFDIEKLLNISKNFISRLSAKEVYDNLIKWAFEFDGEFYSLLDKYKDYSISILNIEREQKKPRKDFDSYSEIKEHIWYMYDELFNNLSYDWQNISDINEIRNILSMYIDKYYNESDDKETWFNNMKELCDELGYASDMKEYKDNSNNYKGSIADISMVIRVALTTKSMTPDLYEIMKLLGEERIKERIKCI
ncbi:MAG TPA: glutamate--tRNA ligase [Bacilli bacterium]|nr:glutamate--tRNA ligase [Bacilli bacterium]